MARRESEENEWPGAAATPKVGRRNRKGVKGWVRAGYTASGNENY